MRFHMTIAKATKNQFIEKSLINPLSVQYSNNPKWLEITTNKFFELSTMIVDAIKQGEARQQIGYEKTS